MSSAIPSSGRERGSSTSCWGTVSVIQYMTRDKYTFEGIGSVSVMGGTCVCWLFQCTVQMVDRSDRGMADKLPLDSGRGRESGYFTAAIEFC
jgi:hypothetical protein